MDRFSRFFGIDVHKYTIWARISSFIERSNTHRQVHACVLDAEKHRAHAHPSSKIASKRIVCPSLLITLHGSRARSQSVGFFNFRQFRDIRAWSDAKQAKERSSQSLLFFIFILLHSILRFSTPRFENWSYRWRDRGFFKSVRRILILSSCKSIYGNMFVQSLFNFVWNNSKYFSI